MHWYKNTRRGLARGIQSCYIELLKSENLLWNIDYMSKRTKKFYEKSVNEVKKSNLWRLNIESLQQLLLWCRWVMDSWNSFLVGVKGVENVPKTWDKWGSMGHFAESRRKNKFSVIHTEGTSSPLYAHIRIYLPLPLVHTRTIFTYLHWHRGEPHATNGQAQKIPSRPPQVKA